MPEIEKQLSFLESTHTYFYGKKEMLSTTRILELAGMSDYSKVPHDLLDRAQTFGRYLHKGCELHDKGMLDKGSVHEELAPYLSGWEAFVEDHVAHFLSIEEMVCDPRRWYAGTLDRVIQTKDGEIALIEIKSSDALHPAAALQTASYKRPWEMKHKKTISQRFAVQPMRGGDYVITEYKNYRSDYADFLACLRVANRKLKDKIK